jgi:colanic acid/amylovoran biosynthesis glycosyltransferase
MEGEFPDDRPLNVAYVVPMGGGLHSFVFREVRELQALGVRVHLFPTKVTQGPYWPRPDWPVHIASPLKAAISHVRVFFRDPARYLSVLLEAFSYGALLDFVVAGFFSDRIETLGLGLIHAHFGDHKFFIAHLCGHLTGRPVTVTVHAYELYNNPNPRLFRHALKGATAVVTVAQYNQSMLTNKYDVPVTKIRVIPLFADLQNELDRSRDENGKIVVLCVARRVEKKGHRTLIEAVARLPKRYEVWIVGGGPLDIGAMAETAGVKDRVRVLGPLSDEDLQSAYRAAAVFCLPSETTKEGDREGIPVALMEAMAYGLPVVATRHAGVPELVEEILVEEGSSKALADALLALGENPRRRLSSGRRNREIASSRFSPRNVLLLKSLFETITRSSQQSRRSTTEALENA